MVGATGFEPVTTCTPRNAGGRPAVTSPSQPVVNTRVSSNGVVQPSHPVPQDPKIFAASLLLGSAPVALKASGSGRLLTVRDVEERLGVCRATVYRLCEQGELRVFRFHGSPALRVVPLGGVGRRGELPTGRIHPGNGNAVPTSWVSVDRVAHGSQDGDAVRAALTSPWSNAQAEGQIMKLKLLKRQMYGRANFDLLRRRVLLIG